MFYRMTHRSLSLRFSCLSCSHPLTACHKRSPSRTARRRPWTKRDSACTECHLPLPVPQAHSDTGVTVPENAPVAADPVCICKQCNVSILWLFTGISPGAKIRKNGHCRVAVSEYLWKSTPVRLSFSHFPQVLCGKVCESQKSFFYTDWPDSLCPLWKSAIRPFSPLPPLPAPGICSFLDDHPISGLGHTPPT